MRLAEIMALRQTICAGVLVTLTERCPLRCAHCSSSSDMRGRQLDGAALLRLVGTFTRECRPDVLMLTGGEPMLRPDLVADTAQAARAAGTRTAALSGAFFARDNGIPAPIMRAFRALDHVSFSLDAFHEREVPRRNVFAVLRTVLRLGVATSLHIVGDDPYLQQLSTEVLTMFGSDVPMLVSAVKPIGRAASWARRQHTPPDGLAAAPCAMAAWPVVTADGHVVSCCNQSVVDGPARPEHLRLGELGTTWASIRARAHNSPVLRMIRTVGPVYIASQGGSPGSTDYCGTCQRLGESPSAVEWAVRAGSGPAGELLQATASSQAGGVEALIRRHGVARYAHLVGKP
ncbi:radical SAM protein [Kibdelosporangium aridum]|uniref:Radical SAM protein n=1 Tax=Kibdelosporangium aridum TaxID=2030 RepID=A0A428Z0U7_KIBAR|nr:radical SAM protein [Kibdelosporangium aridum]RSM78147.1 radical SAM protein [Kibdelosporangium aridum]